MQDTFAAVITTIMNGTQARVDQAIESLSKEVEAQRCQVASLAHHIAMMLVNTGKKART